MGSLESATALVLRRFGLMDAHLEQRPERLDPFMEPGSLGLRVWQIFPHVIYSYVNLLRKLAIFLRARRFKTSTQLPQIL